MPNTGPATVHKIDNVKNAEKGCFKLRTNDTVFIS